LFYALSRHVADSAAERVHPVFLLDESHLLHQDTLDHLHILLNYAWDSRALLSLVLVGLPELRERLALRRNRSRYSRIHHRLEISPLTPDDTTEYLRMRLERAGCTREVFASDATVLLHEATVGAMRDLDRLAAAALRESARKKAQTRRARRRHASHRGRYAGTRPMTVERIVTTRHLAALESAVATASRALLATYPEAGRELCDGEPVEVTVVRALIDDCDHLLAALEDYRAHLVIELPRNPDQLAWPF
jgi:hypothetical protein